MFRTPGKATVIKKNIRAFSGFPEGFDVKKTEELLSRAFAPTLNMVLDLFDLQRGAGNDGKKEAKVARIMEFMTAPKESGKKNMKAAADEKREKTAEKREKVAAKKEKLAEKKEKAKAKKDKAKGKKTGGDASKKTIPSDTESIKAELQAMAQRQAALLAKLEKAAASPPAKPKPARKAKEPSEDAPAAKKAKEDEAEAEEASDSDEQPESKKPSDADLQSAIKEMLDGADMESISMKKVRGDLEEKFGVPLTDKKARIKEIVNEIVGEA